MIRIICICIYGEVFSNNDKWEFIDTNEVHLCYFNETIQREIYTEGKSESHEIILFPDFQCLKCVKKTVLKNLLNHSDCYVILHDSHKDSQRQILSELAPGFPIERTITASHVSSGVFGTEMLGKVPSVESQDEWNKLIDNIISQFHDEELENLIISVIEGDEEAKAKLDDYISEIKNKV